MSDLTAAELITIVVNATGIDATPTVLDDSIADVGVDSLALLEIVSVIYRQHGVTVSDGDLARVETCRDLLGLVNARAAAA